MLEVITIIAIASNVFLGLLVYRKNPGNATNRLFFFLNIAIAVWSAANYFSLNSQGAAATLFWIRLVMFFAVPLSAFSCLFIYTFPKETLQIRKRYLFTYILLILLTMAATISPYVFIGVAYSGNNIQPISGPLMPLFALTAIGSIGTGIFLLVYKFLKARSVLRAQLRIILIGTIAMFALILFSNVLLVLFFGNSSLVSFSPVYILVFVGAAAYAVVKHRFFDIRLVIARSVAYLITLLLLAFFYTGAVFWLSNLFLFEKISQNQAIVYALLALFVAFTFQSIKNTLERITDKIFFQNKYSSNQLLSSLTEVMATTIHLKELTKETLHILLTTMHISEGAFIIFEKHVISTQVIEGYRKAPDISADVIKKLVSPRKMIIYEEEENSERKNILRDEGIAVALPLFSENEELGILILGEKRSGDIYSNQDIQVLEIFGSEVSVAVSNAKSYEEITRFNVTLREEVSKATKDLKHANDKLKQLDLLKDDFVSVASHELRTPMTAIKSYLWMALAGKGGRLSEKQKYYLERSYNSVDRLIKLVNDMLNISRIESGRLTVELQKVDLGELAQEVTEEVTPRAKELGVIVKMDVKGKLVPVIADPDKMKEVFFNLIGNSLKFTPKGGSVTTFISQTKDATTVEVKDTGVGIAKEDLSKLFQKFGLLPGSYTTNQPVQGTGLGLYISRSIVEIHGGSISAASEGKNKGAVFTFTLHNYSDSLLTQMRKKYKSTDSKESIGIIHTALT